MTSQAGDALPALGPASMEPRSGDRGDFDLGDVTDEALWASMEPRSGDRGDARFAPRMGVAGIRFNGAAIRRSR